MSIKRLTTPLAVMISVLALALTSGCNSKSDPIEEDYVRGTELTVTKFYLKADYKVMRNLDSVYFAIDLERGIIYNADSLPMGTKVNKLIPMITYPATVDKAELIIQGDSAEDRRVVDYKDTPGDSIDFTKKVTLELSTSGNGMLRSYEIKVNVHKMNPDSLDFDVEARMALPSRLAKPKREKSVSRDGKVYMMIEEADGSRTLSTTTDMASGMWEKKEVASARNLRVETLAGTSDAFFMLDDTGHLYRSADCLTWSEVSSQPAWTAIVGGYGSALQGLRNNGNGLVHTQYPLNDFRETAVEPTFPQEGFSNMSLYTNKWSSSPLALLSGGRYDGGATGSTWAFDGTRWIDISDTPMPPVYGGTMVPYFAYLRTSQLWLFNEYSIWMYIGGRLADGSPNKKIYLSYDNGVHWKEAPKYMQLPDAINSYYEIGHVVMDTPLDANFEPKAWRGIKGGERAALQKKLPYVINGYMIEWNCPFIYLTGGYTEDDSSNVSPWIYRGVINRMRFKPLI